MTTLAAEPKTRMNFGRIIGKIGPVLGLVLVVTFFGIMRPKTFITYTNFDVMLTQTAVVGTAAIGMTMIIVTGGIDLSVGSTIALVTVIMARLLAAEVSPLAAALMAVAAGAICGLIIGLLVTGLRLAPFIVTLGTWGAYRGLAKGIADEQTVVAPTSWINSLLQATHLPAWLDQLISSVKEIRVFHFRIGQATLRFVCELPLGVWLTIVLAIIVSLILHFTRFGRHVFALGSNEQTARLCGVPVSRDKVLVYALAGAFAGLAGVLQFSYLSVGDPTTANGLELQIIAAVVIGGASLSGGQGTILGTMIGALIMTVVANGCTKLDLRNWVQEIVTGGIILLAVIVDRLRSRGARE